MRTWVPLSLLLLAGCSRVAGKPGPLEGTVRVATYNVQWFSEDADPGRIKNLKGVLAKLDADIVGFQEIQSKKALRQLFDGSWDIGMADDPTEAQELAIAVRKPHVLVSANLVFDSPNLDDAFPGKRDVLRCVIQTSKQKQVVIYVVHFKSRRDGRLTTDPRREAASGLLAAYIHGRRGEPNVVVLGDLNDAPDDRSANILEQGSLVAMPGDSAVAAMLVNLTDPLWAKDVCSIGLHRLDQSGRKNSVVPGAKADNARLRGKDYQFPADVKVEQIMFDQILVSKGLAWNRPGAAVFYDPLAVTGEAGSTRVESGGPVYSSKGDLASDHLPVYVDLSPR